MSSTTSFYNPDGAMPPPDDGLVELVSLYLAGALDEDASLEVGGRLRSGDAALMAAMRHLGDAALALGLSTAENSPEPSPHVRSRILRRVTEQSDRAKQAAHAERTDRTGSSGRTQVWRGWSEDRLNEGLFTLRADDSPWQDTGVEGVQVRRLFVDRPNNRMTAMFKMAPGSEYPDHLHDGVEECYVLQGELRVGDDLTMKAGDYQRAEGGSHHGRQWTTTGCVILVSSSLSDEIVD